MEQGGNLTSKDRLCLHQILLTFFLQSHKDKKIEIMSRAHMQLENLEKDLEGLSIYGS